METRSQKMMTGAGKTVSEARKWKPEVQNGRWKAMDSVKMLSRDEKHPVHPICKGAGFHEDSARWCKSHADYASSTATSAEGRRWLDAALAADSLPWDVPALREVARAANEKEQLQYDDHAEGERRRGRALKGALGGGGS